MFSRIALKVPLGGLLVHSPQQRLSIIHRRVRTMASEAIPVIVCGKTEQIGKPVVAGLKPEIDSKQFVA